ncbi:MAG TPA: hypothetical protein VGI10_09515 [Polyangiaceae bacterium]|jgi:hypothetical protein
MKARYLSALAMCVLATATSRSALADPPVGPPPGSTAGGLSPIPVSNQEPIKSPTPTPTTAPPNDGTVVPVPGSRTAPGLGLSPESPQSPPSPGATPSFGSTKSAGDASFQLGGTVSLIGTWGIAHRYGPVGPGQSALVLRTPARASRVPLFGGPTARLRFTYGTPVVAANVQFFAQPHGKEWEGFNNPQRITQFNQAWLAVTPPPLGKIRLQVRVGAFSDAYGSPGEWGWGVFGPLLALRGYGEGITGEYDLNANWRASFGQGVGGIPSVPEYFVRGSFAGYNATGVSTLYEHAHLGLAYQNKYTLKLHAATAYGTDERRTIVTNPHDGRMNVFVAEAHWLPEQFGQIGLSGVVYNLNHSTSISDGVWWTLGFTQGGQDIGNNYVGTGVYGTTQATGRIEAVAAEWDVSLARILWYPQAFDGRSADLRFRIGGDFSHTSAAVDPAFRGVNTYAGTFDLEYRMLSWFSTTLRGFAESREVRVKYNGANTPPIVPGRYEQAALTPGISFHTDWQTTDHIDLLYTHYWMNSVVDSNPGLPFDRNVLTLWANLDF